LVSVELQLKINCVRIPQIFKQRKPSEETGLNLTKMQFLTRLVNPMTSKMLPKTMNPVGLLIMIILLLFDNKIDCRHHEKEVYSYDEFYKNNSNPGAFVQIPHSNPPTVKPPPYTISDNKCPCKFDYYTALIIRIRDYDELHENMILFYHLSDECP
jgi:hypothetical protein